MKRTVLLSFLLLAFAALKAQWVNNPTSNTFIANCASGAGEVLVSTDPATGDTYVQWLYGADNGWSQWIQRVDAEGVPQWDANGIHITTPNLATWSPGYALAALTDGSVVSMNRNANAHHYVVKINADGSTPWGTDGLMLFNGEGGGRSELLAGDDGGFWALGTDMDSTFLQYVNADGTLRNSVTIKDPAKKCTNCLLLPSNDGVFVIYAKQTIQGYTSYVKEIYLAGYNKDGEQTIPETLLLGQQTVGMSYIHYGISDGMGGGYVYQWHNAIGGAYNIYVTHFNANGAPTILDLNGIPVHSTDPNHYYTNGYATVDPVSTDLIIAYRQTDSDSQTQDKVLMNRFTASGEKPWGDGLAVTNFIGDYAGIKVNAFEYGDGFAVIYSNGNNAIQAVGYDMTGSPLWNTTMSSNGYEKSISENSSGFHQGQNIIAWVNSTNGGVYGQNIGWDGTMGEVTPPEPPAAPCNPPTYFQGEYVYHYPGQYELWGALLSWTAPETQPLHYNLYVTNIPPGCETTIEIDPTLTEYYDETDFIGTIIYRLTAVYEDCESEYALTDTGDDYILIDVTSLPEPSVEEELAVITKIYTLSGQLLRTLNLEELGRGVYIVQGLTKDGKLINKKTFIKK